MLAKIFVILSAWFLVSMIVGLLAGRVISTLQKAPAQGFVPPTETGWGTAALNEPELVLSHAQMQEVS